VCSHQGDHKFYGPGATALKLMKIATWNVNSIRTRLDQVVDWLRMNPVEVLCLQETKVVDAAFPRSPLEDLGYHLYVAGQKSYNGVAILSRAPLDQVRVGFAAVLGTDKVGDLDSQKRVIAGTIAGVQLVNLYVPNGSPIGGEKYDYKLRWLGVLRKYVQALLQETDGIHLCGDFNIALEDRDIHNPQNRENHIMASDAERQALQALLDLGFADVFRKFTASGGHYSWWDYRAGAFRRNRGWRIDHHYLTTKLYQRAVQCSIDTQPRKLAKPSDHVPVIVEL